MNCLHVDTSVRHLEFDGRVAILHLKTGAFFVLGPTASSMWCELAKGASQDEAVDSLARQYAVDHGRLLGDFEQFVGQCRDSGLVADAPPPYELATRNAVPMRGHRTLLAARAWWRLLATTRGLSRRGFACVYEQALETPVARNNAPTLECAARAFALAENFFHLRRAPDDCLPRSLALFSFLRQAGLPAEHHIGVRLYPFSAHAWVECGGRPVRDNPAVPKHFTTIAKVSA